MTALILSLSSSVIAANPAPRTSGRFLVTTVQGDTFLFDYDTKLVVKNSLSKDEVLNVEEEFQAGRVTKDKLYTTLTNLPSWSYGFFTVPKCEVGKAGAIVLRSKARIAPSVSILIDEVASIQQLP